MMVVKTVAKTAAKMAIISEACGLANGLLVL
jgi:hypothetical protein